MKITIATGLYPPDIGGPATYATMLENELPAHDITVEIVPFGQVRRYPKIIRHVIYVFKLWRVSKETDVIYALDPVSVGVPALLVSRLRSKTFLVRLGGDYAWEQGRMRFGVTDTLDDFWARSNTWPWPVRLFARLQLFVTSRAQQVIVPSEYLKSIVVQWGIEEEKIEVIYSALSPLPVEGPRSELREHFSFKYPALISAGRLVPWKGFSVLLEVVDKLREQYPDISLTLVGDGEDRVLLEKKVAELKLSEHVWFMGRVSKKVLGSVVRAADVFVLNTAYEGLSHQLIEVMDIGTPIVTTTTGGNGELITDGINGFLVEFNNNKQLLEAIIRLLGHSGSRERIVQSARLRSKQFTKEIAITSVVKLLNKYE